MWYWAEYSTFSISDEVGKYQLTVAGYRGNAGNSLMASGSRMWNVNGMKFSTPDYDNSLTGRCGRYRGWWYRRCSISCLNRESDAIWNTTERVYDVRASSMLVKRN